MSRRTGAGSAFGAGRPADRPSGPCPCGSGLAYAACCGPLHEGTPAPTALALMRSRYCAYVLGDRDHIVRTWHPRTRPERTPMDDTEWSGLRIVRVEAGGLQDESGLVEFIASWSGPDGPGRLHEVSHFTRRAGRWFYEVGQTV